MITTQGGLTKSHPKGGRKSLTTASLLKARNMLLPVLAEITFIDIKVKIVFLREKHLRIASP